jgi:hypothetical protein
MSSINGGTSGSYFKSDFEFKSQNLYSINPGIYISISIAKRFKSFVLQKLLAIWQELVKPWFGGADPGGNSLSAWPLFPGIPPAGPPTPGGSGGIEAPAGGTWEEPGR